MAKQKTTRVPVTTRALLQRINRKLAHQDEMLKATRNARMRLDHGDYIVIDVRIGGVTSDHVDIEDLGRELGVLRPWEAVAA